MFGKDTRLKLKSKAAGRHYDVEIGKLYEMANDGRITLSGWEIETPDGCRDILSVTKSETEIQEIHTEKGIIAVSPDSLLFFKCRNLSEISFEDMKKLRKTAAVIEDRTESIPVKRFKKSRETVGFSVTVRDSDRITVNEIFPACI